MMAPITAAYRTENSVGCCIRSSRILLRKNKTTHRKFGLMGNVKPNGGKGNGQSQ
jgi:hypothetical protein